MNQQHQHQQTEPPAPFVVVTTYSRTVLARAVLDRLVDARIEWALEEGPLTVRNEAASRVFRRCKLLVPRHEYARARGILGLECTELAPRGDARDALCPECGATLPWHRRLALGLGWGFRQAQRCGACGHWWKFSVSAPSE